MSQMSGASYVKTLHAYFPDNCNSAAAQGGVIHRATLFMVADISHLYILLRVFMYMYSKVARERVFQKGRSLASHFPAPRHFLT